MVFFNIIVLGTLISISSYSWISIWIGLEINLLSIIPLLRSTKNIYSSESAIKYFITQAMASIILLFSISLIIRINEFINPLINFNLLLILNSALLTKIGSAPFHYWFPEVMEGLNWVNCLILLTWQKIAPIILLINNFLNKNFIFLVIAACLIIRTLIRFNQISLRKILAYSSINHIGWILSSILISKSIWLIYFFIYTFISINLIYIFYNSNCFYLTQILTLTNQNKILKINFIINFFSLGGIPPFIGFLPKWLNINWLVSTNNFLLTTILITLTLIIFFVYIRSIFTSIVIRHREYKLFKIKSKFYLSLINFFSLRLLIFCTLLFNFF